MSENGSKHSDTGSFIFARLRQLLTGNSGERDDLIALLRDERWRTSLDSDELAMLHGVLEVSQTQVRDVMIPRSQMVVLERTAPEPEILSTIVRSGHSRFPVIGDGRDEVVGVLLAKDVLRHLVESSGKGLKIDDYLRPAYLIPESKRLNTLLKDFRISRNHMGIVVDEYGGTAGLLTIEDVIEEIVGEIEDEHDPQEAEHIQKYDESRFHVRALTRIDEFNVFFDADLSDDEYDTVGGLIMHQLGRLPRRGESVSFGGFQFKVMQADRRRIHGIDVVREPPAAPE